MHCQAFWTSERRRGTAEPPRPPPGEDRLPGRGAELELIDSLLAGPGRGSSGLLLHGEPGVGKTALLDAAATRATALGMRVPRAAGAQCEARIPYSALHQLLYPVRHDADRLDEEALAQAARIGPPGAPTPGVPGRWMVLDYVEAAVRTGHLADARAHVRAAQEAGLPRIGPRVELITAGAVRRGGRRRGGRRAVRGRPGPSGRLPLALGLRPGPVRVRPTAAPHPRHGQCPGTTGRGPGDVRGSAPR
ncbi:ATP-binding protein [Streptomyces sp. 900105755]